MSIIDVIQSVGIVITIVIAIWQMRLQIKSTQASIYASILERMREINRLSIEYPEVVAKLSEPFPQNSDIAAGDQLSGIMFTILNLYEELFYHHKKGYIDDEIWDGWTKTIQKDVKLPYAMGFWEKVKEQYGTSYRDFINTLREK